MLVIENNILFYVKNNNFYELELDGEIPKKILNSKYVLTEANHVYEISIGLNGIAAIQILKSHNIKLAFAFDNYNPNTIIIQNENGDVHIIKFNSEHRHQTRNIIEDIKKASIYTESLIILETKNYYYSVLFLPDQVVWEQLQI